MKFEAAASFHTDYARLNNRERELFAAAVRQLNRAYEHRGSRWPPSWPGTLRIKPIQRAPGVWELTWSFSGPDGRATLEFITIEGEPAVRWRRIGGHETSAGRRFTPVWPTEPRVPPLA